MTDRHKPSKQIRLPIAYYDMFKSMARNNQTVAGVIMDLADKQIPRDIYGKFIKKAR